MWLYTFTCMGLSDQPHASHPGLQDFTSSSSGIPQLQGLHGPTARQLQEIQGLSGQLAGMGLVPNSAQGQMNTPPPQQYNTCGMMQSVTSSVNPPPMQIPNPVAPLEPGKPLEALLLLSVSFVNDVRFACVMPSLPYPPLDGRSYL